MMQVSLPTQTQLFSGFWLDTCAYLINEWKIFLSGNDSYWFVNLVITKKTLCGKTQ